MKKIVCFGEVLWDILPGGKKVGGAPLNVAIRLRALENDSYIISSIGNDELGKQLLKEIEPYKINLDYMQVEQSLATSEVIVKIDEKGIANYDIVFPRAWDEIRQNDETCKLVQSADAFVFGSLVARNNTSRETLLAYLDYAKFKIFDVNLRPPFFTTKLLENLMIKADFIKLNDEELYDICKDLGSTFSGLEENIRYLVETTGTLQMCVTLGEKGAILFTNQQFYYNTGYKINVVDTVGSGDSFLATLISKLLKNTEPQKAINYACAVGAMVAQNHGANPVLSHDEIDKFILSHNNLSIK